MDTADMEDDNGTNRITGENRTADTNHEDLIQDTTTTTTIATIDIDHQTTTITTIDIDHS